MFAVLDFFESAFTVSSFRARDVLHDVALLNNNRIIIASTYIDGAEQKDTYSIRGKWLVSNQAC